MKTLTKSDVLSVAEGHINQSGSTTNLDIKRELRGQGFYATQEAVAEFMGEIYAEKGWDFSFNGKYRTYTESSANVPASSLSSQLKTAGGIATDDTDEDDEPTALANSQYRLADPQVTVFSPKSQSITLPFYTKRNGNVILSIDENCAEEGDFKVWSISDPEVLYFPGHYTRDEIRYAYSVITGSEYVDTRIKTVR